MKELATLLDWYGPERIWILTDDNVNRLVVPRIETELRLPAEKHRIVIAAEERAKSIETAQRIWRFLAEGGATRSHLLLNIGGGMVSDIGGFCASTFKRGMAYANVATTVLGAADACIGGKTGIDFLGLKNLIGSFAMPQKTVLYVPALDSLPYREQLSGFGEILKTALIGIPSLLDSILSDAEELFCSMPRLARMAEEAGDYKMQIVRRDPHEQYERKVLNFGHTFGHAFESLALEKGCPMPHGVCIAHGIVSALVLSHLRLDCPSELLHRIAKEIVAPYYKTPAFTCDDYPRLLELMRSDKKNAIAGQILFVLLRNKAIPEIDVPADDREIAAALDITRDLLGS